MDFGWDKIDFTEYDAQTVMSPLIFHGELIKTHSLTYGFLHSLIIDAGMSYWGHTITSEPIFFVKSYILQQKYSNWRPTKTIDSPFISLT